MENENKFLHPRNSQYAFFTLFITASPLPFLVGFGFSFVNNLVPTLEEVYNNTFTDRYNMTMEEPTWSFLLSLSTSACVLCALIATVTAKYFLTIIAPKRLQQIAHVVNIASIVIMALGTGISGSYEAFITGRFLSGYAYGISYVVVPMQISEISACCERSRWQSVMGISMSFGMLLGPVLAHPDVLGSTTLYPVVICIGAFPSILYLVSSAFVRNSPYYFVRNDRLKEAEEVLRKSRKPNQQLISFELEEIKSELGKSTKGLVGIREILRTAKYRNQFIGVLALLMNQILSGITNISFYSTSFLFMQAGFDTRGSAFATIAVACLQFLFTLLGPKTVKKFGAFRLCIGSNVLLISSLLLFTFAETLAYLAKNVLPFVSVIAVALFMVAWAAGINIGTYALISEITIEPTRATCMTYGSVALWFSIWLVGFIPPYLHPVFGPYSMVLWIACASLFTVYMVFCLPDTRGKTPEQVQLELDGPFIKRKFFGVSTRQFRQRIFEKPLNAPVDVFHVT